MTKRTATKTVARKPVTKKTSTKAQRRTVTTKMTPKLPAAVKKNWPPICPTPLAG